MNIGMVCYASVGGSGIIATELAKSLATRGHEIHLISAETPFRLGDYLAGLSFHRVHRPSYPLFRESQYLLPLANRLVQLSREVELDVIHAHYAIPHATAAYLAREIIASGGRTRVPKVITTLHGTDITLLGSDPSYSDTVAFSIDGSDGVTAVSESLKADTYRALPVSSDIHVIPTFVDCHANRRRPSAALKARLCPEPFEKLVIHVSNFRPVKRAEAAVQIFGRIRERVPARLLLVGEGPDLVKACRLARSMGLSGSVEVLGEQDQVLPLLSVSDVFLLPSAEESFGLAALEAMACEVPVVATDVGGLPEVLEHGVTGFLHAPDDLAGMADSAIALLENDELRQRTAHAGRRRAESRFCSDIVVPQYERFYDEVLAMSTRSVPTPLKASPNRSAPTHP